MKIAFDFDNTLNQKYIQKLAQKFIQEGHDVLIITSRSNRQGGWAVNDDNSDLIKVANKLGIDQTIYTSNQDKLLFMPDDVDLFFDDDMEEVELINQHMENTVAICSRPMSSNIKIKEYK